MNRTWFYAPMRKRNGTPPGYQPARCWLTDASIGTQRVINSYRLAAPQSHSPRKHPVMRIQREAESGRVVAVTGVKVVWSASISSTKISYVVQPYRRDMSLCRAALPAGYEHHIFRQNREPVVHPFGVGDVLPVRKEPGGVGERQPAFDLVDLQCEGDCLRGGMR